MANRSPPTPHDIGSTTPRVALAARAASMALPPLCSTARPAPAASGWLVATMPLGAMTTERPVLYGLGVRRVPGGRSGTAAEATTARATTAARHKGGGRWFMSGSGKVEGFRRYCNGRGGNGPATA